jgi:hypothetical protein
VRGIFLRSDKIVHRVSRDAKSNVVVRVRRVEAKGLGVAYAKLGGGRSLRWAAEGTSRSSELACLVSWVEVKSD